VADVEKALPGYAQFELSEPEELAGTADWTRELWQQEFDLSRERLTKFLAARDPLIVLARTAARIIVESGKVDDALRAIEQPEAEILQALIVTNPPSAKSVPTSPGNFVRLWPLVSRHIHTFIRKLPREEVGRADIRQLVSHRARLHTLYYRNLFTRPDCEQVLQDLLTGIDRRSEAELGYRLSDLFRAGARLSDLVTEQLGVFAEHLRTLLTSQERGEVATAIDFFRSAYTVADRAWRGRAERFADLETLRAAAFQMSELAYPWVFTVSRKTLEAEFAPSIVDALYRLSLRPGAAAAVDPQHIYLNNPIWRRPYLRLDDDSLFVPLPQLIFSFPFAIVEGLMEGHPGLQIAYENAKADYLESATAALLRSAMPSATVYEGVIWDDPETGQQWENDVVAVVGNFIFVFEAKSGRISDAARRGGDLSLTTNFRELFVEPGIQAWRLQNYLDRQRQSAILRLKADNSRIDIGLDKHKVVFTFSICIEHFTALTSAKYYLKEMGLVENDTAWAPVLSLGELKMIDRFLDSEVSFVHYLTRRATLEDLIDFDGDEQDILSVYLTNGLWIDASQLDGGRVAFHNADGPVRVHRTPRADRTAVEVPGVQLSRLWLAIVKELYEDGGQRHRFDLINVILNQLPPALADIERRVRRFRRGVPIDGQDVISMKFEIGKRVYLLVAYLARSLPELEEWREVGKRLMELFMPEDGTIDCAAFIFARRSKEATFDGVSFYRAGVRPKPKDAC